MAFLLPGPDVAIGAAKELYVIVNNVQVYREQCRDLARRCTELELAVQENGKPGATMEQSRALAAADELSNILNGLGRNMRRWARYSFVESLWHQGDIKKAIDDGYKQIDLCFQRFNLASSLEMSRNHQELVEIQQRDQMELLEQLREILNNTDQIRALMQTPQEADVIMQAVQESLQHSNLDSAPAKDLQKGLWRMHEASNNDWLPPLPELDGQVEKLSNRPVARGGFSDIYQGQWLGEEKVALKFPRAINDSEKARRKFLEKIRLWRDLQHPNVERFYGIVTFDEDIYSVSPWMENGNAMDYLKHSPGADRLRILVDVVLGMEYLHLKGVVHGDLRGANILIKRSGRACISDFGVSRVIVETAEVSSSTTTTGLNVIATRWSAPELVNPELINKQMAGMTRETDIWSFGMTCLELMTGAVPYQHRLDTQVILDLSSFKLPPRPEEPAVSRGLDDRLWNLITQACWERDPAHRWSMTRIKTHLRGHTGTTPSGNPTSPVVEAPSSVTSSYSTASSSLPRTPQKTLAAALTGRVSVLTPRERIQGFEPTGWRSSPPRDNTIGSERPTYTSQLSVSPSKQLVPLPDIASSPTLTKPSHRRPSSASGFQSRSSQDSARSPVSPDYDRRFASHTQLGTIDAKHALLDFESPSGSSQKRATRPSIPGDEPPSLCIPIPGATSPLETSPGPIQNSFSDTTPSFGSYAHPGRMHRKMSGISSTSSLSQLERACRDPNPYYKLSIDGRSLEAGNLEGLIDRLLGDRRDEMFERSFLITFRIFTSAQSLVDILIRKFEETGSRDMASESRAHLRFNILRFTRDWFENHFIERDRELLHLVKAFGSSVDPGSHASTLVSIARQLTALADLKLRSLEQPSPSPPLGERLVPSSSERLALALTTLEGRAFALIKPGQCVASIRRRMDLDSVPFADFSALDSAREMNENIVYWVKKAILDCDHVEDRVERIKWMTQAAEKCREQRNFSSMFAVVLGLRSPEIANLTITQKRLSKKEKTALASMDRLMDWPGGHAQYRLALTSSKTAIPYMEIHLRDFYKLLAKSSSTIEFEGYTMVNFIRCTELAKSITDIIGTYQPPSTGSDPAEVAYLDNQLRKIKRQSDIKTWCEQRSAYLRDVEAWNHRNHVEELAATGLGHR